jgi:hypothetical protein
MAKQNSIWFYQLNGESVGPFTVKELKARADKGTIHRTTPVCSEDGTWIEAGKVPGLFPPAKGLFAMSRDRKFGTIGILWGAGILVYLFLNGPRGPWSYRVGAYTGMAFGALMFCAGIHAVLKKPKSRA